MPGCLSLFSLCPVRCFLPSLRLINCLSISLCPICCYTLSLCTISRLPLSSLYPLFSPFSFHYQLPYYFFPLHLLSSLSLRHIGFLFPLLSALYRPVIILTRFKATTMRAAELNTLKCVYYYLRHLPCTRMTGCIDRFYVMQILTGKCCLKTYIFSSERR